MTRTRSKTAARRVRAAAKLVERVKELRKVARGFDAKDGYNLRDPSSWTPAQKARVTRYANVVERMTHSSVKVVPVPGVFSENKKVSRQAKRKLKALQKFSNQPKALRDLKAAFIQTPAPERTDVEVDDSGAVRVFRDGVEQAHFIARDGLESDADVMAEAERLMDAMPAGFYVVLTGQSSRIDQLIEYHPLNRDALRSAVRQLVEDYPTGADGDERFSRVAYFFHGFRRVARTEAAAEKEIRRVRKVRDEQKAERREARLARERAIRAEVRKAAERAASGERAAVKARGKQNKKGRKWRK